MSTHPDGRVASDPREPAEAASDHRIVALPTTPGAAEPGSPVPGREQSRDQADTTTTRRKRRWAFLTGRPSTWSVLVPAVAVLAGVLFATSGSVADGHTLRTSAYDIPDLIREGTRANATDARRVDELQAEIEQLTQQQASSDKKVSTLRAKGDAVADAAGYRKVAGPTIQVTLTDSPIKAADLPPGFTVDDLVVHQQDVQAVVNALWAGGAEAMMLMDQRVIATSAVRCVGNTLILKGRVYSPPFVIRAIGNVAEMSARLDADRTVQIYREYVARLGLGYDVRTERKTTFPAYSGSITPQFAKALS